MKACKHLLCRNGDLRCTSGTRNICLGRRILRKLTVTNFSSRLMHTSCPRMACRAHISESCSSSSDMLKGFQRKEDKRVFPGFCLKMIRSRFKQRKAGGGEDAALHCSPQDGSAAAETSRCSIAPEELTEHNGSKQGPIYIAVSWSQKDCHMPLQSHPPHSLGFALHADPRTRF